MYYKTNYSSPIGDFTLGSDGENIVGLWRTRQKYFGSGFLDEAKVDDELEVFKEKKNWLDDYFAGKKPEISKLPLLLKGSEFREDVWKILCEIPYGEVITYGDIAKRMAKIRGVKRMSAQAVGGAVGHNPISIIVPCHRVVGSTGSLTGYAGGIDTKIKLLELEGVDLSKFTVPKKGTAL